MTRSSGSGWRPTWCCATAARWTPRRCRTGFARSWPATRCPATCISWISCRVTTPARWSSASWHPADPGADRVLTRATMSAMPSAAALAADLRAGRRDPVEVLERTLARIDEVDGHVKAFVLVEAEAARREAEERWRAQRAGEPMGPLHGVPVGVKDLFDVVGQHTRAGSEVPPGPSAAQDAVAVARMREAGA